MCLYPKLIINRKYIPNKKNKYNAPKLKDPRTLYVPVGCQKCMECKKQKARQWAIRMQEEVKTHTPGTMHMVTLTFSNESIKEIKEAIDKQNIENVDKETGEILQLEGYALDNEIATVGVRRFLERWRKEYGVSVKHWLITELGHNGTENIHLHGIIFTDKKNDIEKKWKYGYVFIGDYVNEKTVNYCVKYVTKVDIKHKEYNAKILTSSGIGNNYTNRQDAKRNKYKKGQTKETYTTRQGTELNLPVYYRNKIYTEEEREQLWIEKLDKEERWVDGSKVDISNGYRKYDEYLKYARMKNKRLGYGDDEIDWDRKKYENQRRKLQMQKRLDNK